MKVAILPVGQLRANCIILSDESGIAAVVDPGGDAEQIISYLESNNLKTEAILITHTHLDHIGALEKIREYTGAPVYVHEEDAGTIKHKAENLLKGGEEYTLGALRFSVLHTPGHSRGSVCYLFDGLILSGDTLFRCSIGRTDFFGGSPEKMAESLQLLLSMGRDKDTVIPGHGMTTTLEYEKEFNPFL